MQQIELDHIDFAILKQLQIDGRLPNANLAEKIGLSTSACLRRTQRLIKERVISGTTAVINPQALGLLSEVFVHVTLKQLDSKSMIEFEDAVKNCNEISSCHLMAGQYDYLLRIAVSDVRHFEIIHANVISNLPHVARMDSRFTLRQVCDHPYLLPIS